MKNLPLLFFIVCASVLVLSVSSCYYDKEEVLYPDSICDTADVRYSTTVQPVLNSNCVSCHGGSTPSAGIKLDTYDGVSIQAANGRLWGAVSHSNNFSPMPKNANKLSDCSLAKIKKWLDAGHPNN
jgi:mono/diheme cytochrome c family protein